MANSIEHHIIGYNFNFFYFVFFENLSELIQIDLKKIFLQVYVGYTGVKSTTDQIPVDECIAIKIYKNETKRDYLNGMAVVETIKTEKTKGTDEFEHIVSTIDQ